MGYVDETTFRGIDFRVGSAMALGDKAAKASARWVKHVLSNFSHSPYCGDAAGLPQVDVNRNDAKPH